jgi:hypothetical protein
VELSEWEALSRLENTGSRKPPPDPEKADKEFLMIFGSASG